MYLGAEKTLVWLRQSERWKENEFREMSDSEFEGICRPFQGLYKGLKDQFA